MRRLKQKKYAASALWLTLCAEREGRSWASGRGLSEGRPEVRIYLDGEAFGSCDLRGEFLGPVEFAP